MIYPMGKKGVALFILLLASFLFSAGCVAGTI
jgi:hypothetical protein